MQTLNARLLVCTPAHRIEGYQKQARTLESRIANATRVCLAAARSRLSGTARGLDVASPLGTLERGYAVITRCDDGSVVRDAERVVVGDRLEARLARGRIVAKVLSTET